MCHRRSRSATALGSLGRFPQTRFDLRRHCVWRRDASPKELPDLRRLQEKKSTPDQPNPAVPKWTAVDAYFADKLAPPKKLRQACPHTTSRPWKEGGAVARRCKRSAKRAGTGCRFRSWNRRGRSAQARPLLLRQLGERQQRQQRHRSHYAKCRRKIFRREPITAAAVPPRGQRDQRGAERHAQAQR